MSLQSSRQLFAYTQPQEPAEDRSPMWYKSFEFSNYKGIQSIKLDLSGDVTTLIGLNESGKTTLLEAIFSFSYGAEDLSAIDPALEYLRDPERWIPIAKRGNFNGTISITATVGLDSVDQYKFRRFMFKEHALTVNNAPQELKISERYNFKNSKVDGRSKIWFLELAGTTGKQRKPRTYGGKSKEWLGAVAYLKTRLPRIWYFPNFLFELPERFELEPGPSVTELSARDQFFKETFDRVVKKLDSHAALDTHIVERIHSNARADKRNLDSLLLDMSRNITTTVFDSWYRILATEPTGYEVVLQAGADPGSSAYLELKIKGPGGYFDLSERSLGFRWFFMFLLMTSFHEEATPTQKPLFLFDEPASNLHSSAQAELLKSFSSLTERCHLVYSTHSHHMISLKWLNTSYVVANTALGDLNFDDYINSSASLQISISATRYRHFVSQNPTKLSYVQPVLDLLDYRPSNLEPVPDIVMVEGKIDFYFLRYVVDTLAIGPYINVAPGTGAGSLDTLVRLYIAWGKKFLVLLDSDHEGREQKKRYEKLFGSMVSDRLVLLSEMVEDTSIHGPEDLMNAADKTSVVERIYAGSENLPQINKKNVSNAIIELFARNESIILSEQSMDRFKLLVANLARRLDAL